MIKSVDSMPISAPVREKPQPKSASTKVGFVSLGCPKNLVDSEVMMGILAASGAEITPDADQADVIVVNTCSLDRKSTRLNSSHLVISYAVFCLKKKSR